jgi:hypothetical protein
MAITGQPITPLRIDELESYIQLLPEDTGYIDPATLFIPIGSSAFGAVKAKKISVPAASALGLLHVERGDITGLTSRTFARTFNTAFDAEPYGKVEAYYMLEIETGKWVKQEVQFYYPSADWLTTTGFTIVIDDDYVTDEILPTIIIKYKFE